ncbi:hypothetical protein FGB62_36g010 [Gracilaria domingensis]|nr:hypothetical protein FGB62_36g010 [Gracilaria domingensis]
MVVKVGRDPRVDEFERYVVQEERLAAVAARSSLQQGFGSCDDSDTKGKPDAFDGGVLGGNEVELVNELDGERAAEVNDAVGGEDGAIADALRGEGVASGGFDGDGNEPRLLEAWVGGNGGNVGDIVAVDVKGWTCSLSKKRGQRVELLVESVRLFYLPLVGCHT